MPRAVLRTQVDPTLPGPSHTLTFRFSRGTSGEIITTIALILAASFQPWKQSPPEATTFDYWMPRILVKLRMNKPIRVVIAVSYGALFAGVYEALQGRVIESLDRLTQIVLSTGQNLSPVCLGGIFCNKCGQPGHIARDCVQSSTTPRNELTYRCPLCGELAGPVKGHEWDACNKYKTIRMGAPTDTACGICGHPEHSTPQCPSLFDTRLGEVMLSPKMRVSLVNAGWSLGMDSQSSPPLSSPSTALNTSASAAVDTIVHPATPSPTQPSRHPWRAAASPSISSTDSTVSLTTTTDQESMMAVANAKVYDLVRDAMRGELAPIQTQLGTISRAVENQGTNIESLTEMLDDFGTRLEGVEAKEAATNQRIARMRARLQQRQSALPAVESSSTVPVDQMSEHSQEDNYQDANPYNPAFPSDDWDAEPFPPGLESPAISMQP